MDNPTTPLEAYEMIKKMLYPKMTQEELDLVWPDTVVYRLSTVLEDLKKAKVMTEAAWRKNTYGG